MLYYFWLRLVHDLALNRCVLNALYVAILWQVLNIAVVENLWNVLSYGLDSVVVDNLLFVSNVFSSWDSLIFYHGFLVGDILNAAFTLDWLLSGSSHWHCAEVLRASDWCTCRLLVGVERLLVGGCWLDLFEVLRNELDWNSCHSL
jgi:hypothetical protein